MPDDQNQTLPNKPARRSPLDGVWKPGDYGRIGIQGPGVTLSNLRDMSEIRIHTEPGAAQIPLRVPDHLSGPLGLSHWPEPGRASEGRASEGQNVRAIRGGPDHVTLSAPDSAGLHERIHTLQHELSHASAVRTVDQSHGHAIIRVSGPKARDLLAKGTGVDLHPKTFAEDHVAHTTLFHHAVTIDRRRGAGTYDVHVMRGFAADLLARMQDHAAEYGYRMR